MAGPQLYNPATLEDGEEVFKYYGYLVQNAKQCEVLLVTSSRRVKLGPRLSRIYNWNQVTACFKTKFILPVLEKLVIIMDDGCYVVIPGSVAELEGDENRILAKKTGGTSFDELFRQFRGAAKVKDIGRVPQVCLSETIRATLYLLTFLTLVILTDLDSRGPVLFRPALILSLLFLFQIYCTFRIKSLARRLCRSSYHSKR